MGDKASLHTADGHRAAGALKACADAVIIFGTDFFEVNTLRGGHLSHTVSDGDVAARSIETTTDAGSIRTASSRDGAASDEDVFTSSIKKTATYARSP